MFNVEKPNLEALPSSAQLLRSTIVALACAIVVLLTIVMPAEYGIDPTGVGRALGLTEMGEIKQELADELKREHSVAPLHEKSFAVLAAVANFISPAAYAKSESSWQDEIKFNLEPGGTHELKLQMNAGDVVEYRMIVAGGRVNFDHHAHANGESVSYQKGRGSSGSEGKFEAAFDGRHGWFWRNRDKQSVRITLLLRGSYRLAQ